MSAIPPVRASLRAGAIQSLLTSSPARQLAAAVLVGVAGFGALRVLEAQPPSRGQSPQPAVVERSRPLRDRFGDPLPEGAIRRFGTLRFRHQGVHDLAFTPDGKKLIAGGRDNPLLVFDAATGRKLRELGKNYLPARQLRGFAVSPDGKQVAGCGSDVFIWDLETGRLVRQFYFNHHYNEVVFSPDGSKIAAIQERSSFGRGFELGIVIGETNTGKHAEDWPFHKSQTLHFACQGLAYSPDGKFLAGRFYGLREEELFVYSPVSSRVWLLDAATGKRVRTFGADDVPIDGFAFQPGTGRLATFAKDGVLRFWDVTTGKDINSFKVSKGGKAIRALRFSADGARCALLTDRGRFLTVLDTKEGHVIRRIEGKESPWWVALALSADGGTVACARLHDEACVRVWDVASGVERLADAGHRAAATRLSLSSDERTLRSEDATGRRIHWDLQTGMGKLHSTARRAESDRFTWSPNFSERTLLGPRWRMVYKTRPPSIEVWSRDGAKLLGKWEIDASMTPSVALSPDGRQLAIICSRRGTDATLELWEPEREEKPQRMQHHSGYCHRLLFSHDGKRLIGGGATDPAHNRIKGALWIWDTATGREVRKLVTDSVPGRLLLTADDRILLADTGPMNAVQAWDMETGRELGRMADPSLMPMSKEYNPRSWPTISGLALSADERFLALVAIRDGASSLSIWETGSWQFLRAFPPSEARNDGQTMLFSHDGSSLFAANSDSTILQWDVSGRLTNGRRPPAGEALKEDRLNILWQRLADDPDKAYPAVWEMLDHSADAVPFVIGKVSPVGAREEKRLQQLLGQLDSDSFAEREEASRQLLAGGADFLPRLRQALKDRPSLETRKRLERILESLKAGPPREQLRVGRALAMLEWSGRPEAEQHLRRLAAGVPSASLTRAAAAACQRRNAITSAGKNRTRQSP